MKNPAPAAAAYWRLMFDALDLFKLPEEKRVDAFEERFEAFKAQWPDYPTPHLDKLLRAV